MAPQPSLNVAYRLPVPAALVAANPAWLGELSSPSTAASAPTPATPVAFPVAAGTEVDAVTTGTIAAVNAGTVTLAGTDGATYTYGGVVGAGAVGSPVPPGARIGAAGPGGINLAVAVPDVSGLVCGLQAFQAWAVGMSVDVRALPQTCAANGGLIMSPPASLSQASKVLIVTDGAAGAEGADLAPLLSGSQLTSQVLSLDETLPPAAEAAQIAAAEGTTTRLVVFALGAGTGAQATALITALPAVQPVLWVTPPAAAGTSPSDAAAYMGAINAHWDLRVETLPAALSRVTIGAAPGRPATPWSPVEAQVAASLVSAYAGTAYRLPLASVAASRVLSYAEAQLGKPYVWAGAGPSVFDCSGLTMVAFAQAGITFTHNAYAQYEATKQDSVSLAALQPGDLVFFGPTEAGIHHVGIYVGDNRFIDAPNSRGVVRFDTLGPGWDFFAATAPLSTLALPGAGAANATGLNEDQAFAQALTDATWSPDQWVALDLLWNQESGWNPAADNPTSGAFGIPQALPATKMASAGADWATDPFTQIVWGLGYIQGRYGTPNAAWAHEMAFGWY